MYVNGLKNVPRTFNKKKYDENYDVIFNQQKNKSISQQKDESGGIDKGKYILNLDIATEKTMLKLKEVISGLATEVLFKVAPYNKKCLCYEILRALNNEYKYQLKEITQQEYYEYEQDIYGDIAEILKI